MKSWKPCSFCSRYSSRRAWGTDRCPIRLGAGNRRRFPDLQRQRLNLSAFFKWTGLFILVVAAGILANSVQALHEAGVWNHLQKRAV